MEGRNMDNEVFSIMAEANNNPKMQRLKGYYICKKHGEYIKSVPRKETPCPYCGMLCELLSRIDYSRERVIILAWKENGIYDDARADARKERSCQES